MAHGLMVGGSMEPLEDKDVCLSVSEKNALFDQQRMQDARLQNTENMVAHMNTKQTTALKVAAIAAGLIISMFTWWLNGKLDAFDASVNTMISINTTMSVMAETLRNHTTDADSHPSVYKIDGLTEDVRDAEQEVQDMRIEIEMLKR